MFHEYEHCSRCARTTDVSVVYGSGPTGYHLARNAALGEYTAVRVPIVEEESARDLVRARGNIRQAIVSAKHRFSKLCLHQGCACDGKTTRTGVYWQ